MSSPNNVYYLISRTAKCRLYNNISQILLLYKISGHYNKFDSMKYLGSYHWYVKMSRCGCVVHRWWYITFYVQRHIAYLVACSGSPLVRDGPLGAPAFVNFAYWNDRRRFGRRHHTSNLGLYSLSGMMYYRKSWWSFTATGLDVIIIVSLWNLTSKWRCCRGALKCKSDWQSLTMNLTALKLHQILR